MNLKTFKEEKYLFVNKRLTFYKKKYALLNIPIEIVKDFKLSKKTLVSVIKRDEKSIMVIFK